MSKRYEHKQVGYLLIVALAAGLLFIVYLIAVYGLNWIELVVPVVLGACLASFAKLTVSIDDDNIEIRFGPGVIRKKFPLKDIQSCHSVKNPWYYGWGIHWTPNGWLYNISGSHAVEIRMKTGKKFRIGTDQPNDLKKAIQQSFKKKSR
ncbi:MAG: PH domain-containing protein [Bacillota bacterium]